MAYKHKNIGGEMKKIRAIAKSKKLLSLAVLTVALMVFTVKSGAATLIDTGVIPCDGSTCSGATLSSVVNPSDKWAARFTLGANTAITDIHTWAGTFFTLNTTFTMVLYGDAHTIPDVSHELFLQKVLVVDTGIQDKFNNQWEGLTGLNVPLNAGSYWLSLELRHGDNYDGNFPTDTFGALNPIDSYAFFNPRNGVWLNSPSSDFAFRIGGDVAPVPVPGALYLLLSGLSLFVLRIKSRKKN
jgi:hypothetical protein